MILAGGQGERLYPLTKERSKPAVPFGGIYRIIDFTLSNCINSDLRRIFVLTQYKSHSLDRHLKMGWDKFDAEFGDYLYTVPPQLRMGDRWYLGTADAIYQNLNLLEDERPARVLILSGDHLYKMDYAEMIAAHIENAAALTVAAVETDLAQASSFGVLQVDGSDRIVGFAEKPEHPVPVPGRSDIALINMGVYVFDTGALVRAIVDDAKRSDTHHDFGRNIIPSMVPQGKVHAFRFADENRKSIKYWRDIGTVDSYYEASMDLVAVEPVFNLYDRSWPIRTYMGSHPPAKMVFAQSAEEGGRRGEALDSLVSPGVIISGGLVRRSILSPRVRINSFAQVEDSILMDGVEVGRSARIRRAIIDKNVVVPAGYTVGHDAVEDARRFVTSPQGVVVIPKGARLEED
ncbi:MAG: glucose-1-phosphate adenylyltransferase [Acidobacteria bacterium]|nr:glucose-1-phosphate adenylyltransferase [Acidobacteriota bacterium]